MKKIILPMLCVFLLSGCSKQIQNVLLDSDSDLENLYSAQTMRQSQQFSVEEYYLCSEGDTDNNSNKNSFLLDSEGKVVEAFPGYYVYFVIDKEGFLLDRYAGKISSGTFLVLTSSKDIHTSVSGVYAVGENKWIIDPKERFVGYKGDGNGRVTRLKFGDSEYNYLSKIASEDKKTQPCYGEKGLHTETGEAGKDKIVDKDGNNVLDAQTFYQINKPLVPAPIDDIYYPIISILDVINENCFLITYLQKEYLCSADGRVISISGLDYLSSDYRFYREEDSTGNTVYTSSKYLLLCNNNHDRYHVKVEKSEVTLLDMPESDEIYYQGNGLYLLKNQDEYCIYDGEKGVETCTFSLKGKRTMYVSSIGQKSHLRGIIDKQNDKSVMLKEIEIINEPDVLILKEENVRGPIIADDGFTILDIYDEKEDETISYIMNRAGECVKKISGKVVWADKDYYLLSKEGCFCIFDSIEDNLIISLPVIE